MYKVVILPPARKFYEKVLHSNEELFQRIDNVLESLRMNPYVGKPLKDNLKGRYSVRFGVYRIIYSIEKREVTVYVFDIGHRKEIYR